MAKAPQQRIALETRTANIQDFVFQYTQLQAQTRQAERAGKDLEQMAALNFQMAEQLQGFLDRVRTDATLGSPGGDTVITVDELRMIELESQLRLVRAQALQTAQGMDLGELTVSAVDQQRLMKDVQREMDRLNSSGGGAGGEFDEENEERNPQKVDLDRSNGLYSLTSTDNSPTVDQLIGYTDEAHLMLNLTREIRFVQNTSDRSGGSNCPITMILYGPPGTGKTTSAQAVARTLQFTYMYVNAENVTSMWTGETQKNIVKVFRRGRIAATRFRHKVLLLVDEIDGLIKNRQSQQLTGEEYSRTTTFLQMLTPPVGVDNSRLVCMFTTNNLDNLDSAFVNRARQAIFLGYVVDPEQRARLFHSILHQYTVSMPVSAWHELALRFPELVPRDLVNMSALAQSMIADKFERATGASDRTADLTITLDNPNNRLSIQELGSLFNNSTPATDVRSYFANYQPPKAHVEQWLQLNASSELVPRHVVDEFIRHRSAGLPHSPKK